MKYVLSKYCNLLIDTERKGQFYSLYVWCEAASFRREFIKISPTSFCLGGRYILTVSWYKLSRESHHN